MFCLLGIKKKTYTFKDVKKGTKGTFLTSLLQPNSGVIFPESDVVIECYFYKGVLFSMIRSYYIHYENGKVKTYTFSEIGPTNSDLLPNITIEDRVKLFNYVRIIYKANKEFIKRRYKSLRLETKKYMEDTGL